MVLVLVLVLVVVVCCFRHLQALERDRRRRQFGIT